MIKKNIINKADHDSDRYKAILKLNEDPQSDNTFCVLESDHGNIAVSYYDNNLPVKYCLHGEILFLSYGQSCAVIDLKKKNVLYHDNGAFALIYDMISIPSKEKVLMIGEITVKCFSSEGKLLFNMGCREIITDWNVLENGIEITYYDESAEIIKL